MAEPVTETPAGTLKREIGVFGATMMGIGSMVGTGVFVSIGIAAGVAGPAVLLAIALAAIVATCNALSSAQLAASMPVSGGTYEYGYAYLTPWLGFTAGWMFLCAKTASAATAALGFAGYLLQMVGHESLVVPVAVAAITALTAIVVMGIRRSNRANIAIVSITLFALVFFVLAGMPQLWGKGQESWHPFFLSSETGSPWPGLLEATALMFVAFTGYARIATLGEEMRDPERTIPRAIIATLVVSALLYISVGAVAIAAIGAQSLAEAVRTDVAPLVAAARTFDLPVTHIDRQYRRHHGDARGRPQSHSWAVTRRAGDGAPRRHAGGVGQCRCVRLAEPGRDCRGGGHRRTGADRQCRGDLVVQRLHRADLLRHHQSCRASAAEGKTSLFAADRLGRACRVSGARLLRGAANLDRRISPNRGRTDLARLGAISGPARVVLGRSTPSLTRMSACYGAAFAVVGRLLPLLALVPTQQIRRTA